MNILIFYPVWGHQEYLLKNLKKYLNKYGINITYISFDEKGIQNFFSSNNTLFFSFFCRVFNSFYNSKRRSNYKIIFCNYLLKKYIERFDLVDFNVPKNCYYRIMSECITSKIDFDITLWGSELLRANDREKKELFFFLSKSRRIKCCSPTLYMSLKESYCNFFSSKSFTTICGNSNITNVDKITESDLIAFKNKYLKNYRNEKLIVVLGYNAIPAQNHILMINAVKKLPFPVKDNIYVILPMTYGLCDNYLIEIKSNIKEIGCDFTILTEYMSETDVAALRKITNIFVEMQTSDSFSSTVQTYLYCENTVSIIADWLVYPLVKDAFFLRTSKGNLSNCLNNTISCYEQIVPKCKGNSALIKDITSWDKVSINWFNAYN